MRVSSGFRDFVLDQLAGVRGFRARAMFGGVGLYSGDVFFGILAADVLYFKVGDANRDEYERAGSKPFKPYSDRAMKMPYYNVPIATLEDAMTWWRGPRRAIAVARAARSNEGSDLRELEQLQQDDHGNPDEEDPPERLCLEIRQGGQDDGLSRTHFLHSRPHVSMQPVHQFPVKHVILLKARQALPSSCGWLHGRSRPFQAGPTSLGNSPSPGMMDIDGRSFDRLLHLSSLCARSARSRYALTFHTHQHFASTKQRAASEGAAGISRADPLAGYGQQEFLPEPDVGSWTWPCLVRSRWANLKRLRLRHGPMAEQHAQLGAERLFAHQVGSTEGLLVH